jgi:hypothetical protein
MVLRAQVQDSVSEFLFTQKVVIQKYDRDLMRCLKRLFLPPRFKNLSPQILWHKIWDKPRIAKNRKQRSTMIFQQANLSTIKKGHQYYGNEDSQSGRWTETMPSSMLKLETHRRRITPGYAKNVMYDAHICSWLQQVLDETASLILWNVYGRMICSLDDLPHDPDARWRNSFRFRQVLGLYRFICAVYLISVFADTQYFY